MARRWQDLSSGQRGAVLALVAVEFALTTAAAVDLRHRPADHIRGRKGLWWFGIFVQPVGALAYLLVGRRAEPDAKEGPPAA